VRAQLQSRLLSWLHDASEACEARNHVIHARWDYSATTTKVSVKRGRLKHEHSKVTPEQLMNLARRLWSLNIEGLLMRF
jgi:hypothetical protein